MASFTKDPLCKVVNLTSIESHRIRWSRSGVCGQAQQSFYVAQNLPERVSALQRLDQVNVNLDMLTH